MLSTSTKSTPPAGAPETLQATPMTDPFHVTFPPLHTDLTECLRGRSLQHPLIQFEDAWPAFYSRLNQLYEHRLRKLRGEHTPNEWDRFHPELSPSERVYCLFEPRDTPEYYRLFGQMWTDPELPQHSSTLIGCAVCWSHANISHLMTAAERAIVAALPKSVRLYRGHAAPLRDHWSWTLDREIALRWAIGLPNFGWLSTGIVAKDRLLAFFDRRGEREVLVDSSDLVDIETCRVSPN